MSWEHELAERIKAQQRDDGHYRDGCYLIGHVLSPYLDGSGPLIISILNGQAMLTEEMVDRLSKTSHLREGMNVAVIPGPRALRGGQRFFVQEIPGHSEILGCDGEDCHPIGAITGLRGELNALAARCTALENRCTTLENRCTTLEGRCTTLENRCTALESDVADLKTKVTTLWDWYQHHGTNNNG